VTAPLTAVISGTTLVATSPALGSFMTKVLSRRQFGLSSLAAGLTMGAGLGVLSTGPARAETVLNFQAPWLTDPEFLGYIIAIEKGYYGQAGLKVNYLPGGPNMIPEGALLSGKADITLASAISIARSIVDKGAPLKIIGAQYQKFPQGFMSFADKNIKTPKDLEGKTIAVSTPGTPTFQAFIKLHKLDAGKIRVVPYNFNPGPLIAGEVDVIQDFVTQLPFLIEQASKKPVHYFLHQDFGMPLFANLMTVSTKLLQERRDDVKNFIRASRIGWAENFKDPAAAVATYHDSWFKATGSTIEAENFFNKIQEPLMENAKGFFTLNQDAMDRNIETLNLLGIKATPAIYDTSVLVEL
jgi:ABC-type nitrate/sulfonate/bicarbonate transport system substrate-binding protein